MRKLLKWALVAFLVYYVVKNPGPAAGVAHNIGHGLTTAAASLSTFVSQI